MYKKNKTLSIIAIVLAVLIILSLPIHVMADSISSQNAYELKQQPLKTSQDEQAILQGNIISEDKSKRDEYTKHFITDTGNILVAQYAIPVHYKNSNGEYIDIDNSLVSSEITAPLSTFDESTTDEIAFYALRNAEEFTRTEKIFVNKNSNTKVSQYKKSGKSNLIEIERNGYKISWGYSGSNMVSAREQSNEISKTLTGNDSYLSLPNLSSTILYENIYTDVDLEVVNSTIGIKENLILKKAHARNAFKIEYNIGDLIVNSENHQTISLKDNNGKEIYTISAPYMIDASGAVSEALELKILSNNKGKLSVKLIADKTWLNDDSRVYPVTIDPNILYNSNPSDVSCTYIESADPDTANGNEWYLYTGTLEDGEEHRSLVRINNLPELETGNMIVGATANLALLPENLQHTTYVGVYEITQTWDENNVTWNSFGTGGYDTSLIDYKKFVAGQSAQWIEWDITELVKKWYNGSDNNGFMLKTVDGTAVNQNIRFASSFYGGESAVQSQIDTRPCFTLSYRNNKGLEDRWSYTLVNCGRAGVAYINNYSGNLVFDMPLASTASPVLPAGLSYIYNSYYAGQKYSDSYPYTGRGWKMNIQQTLYETSEDLLGVYQESFPYVYTDADGTEHYFCPVEENGATKYYDEDGLGYELRLPDTSNDDYVIINKNEDKLYFNQSGLLNKIENKSGQSIKINYSGNKITSIADAESDEITFEVNNTTNNYVKKIKDSADKVTTVTFSGSRIGGITYSDGQSVSFTYDDEGKLLSVTDVDGSKVKFTYSSYGSKGVESVCEYGTAGTQGQKITFDRTKFNTTIIQTSGTDGIFNNSNDIITICQFDNFGKVTSTNSKTYAGVYLSASDTSYTSNSLESDASNIKSINKVSQAYTVGANRENLLKNHSLEGTTNWTSAKWGSGDATFSVNEHNSASNVLYGQKSVKMTVTSVTNDARGRLYQNIDDSYLDPGKVYTLSCYVKVTDINPIADDDVYGAVIGLTTFFDDGTSKNYYSEHISKVTDTAVNEGFRRLSVTIKIPEEENFSYLKANLAIHSATGTAYFDGVQLEKATTAGHYNLLENASFERLNSSTQPTDWTGINLTDSISYDCISKASTEGNNSYRITGSVSKHKNFYQNVYLTSDAKEADTYILSGWATGDAVPIGSNGANFRLLARVYYTDGTHKDKANIKFNDSLENVNWQYASGAFNLSDEDNSTTKTPSYIKVYLVYNNQSNRAYFDNLMLTKEAVPSYTYDENGNLVSMVANAEQNSVYTYSDDMLTSVIDPANNRYEYEYDSNKRITSATSATGLKYSYTYDTKGNANSLVASSTTGPSIKSEVNYTYPQKGADTYTISAYNQHNYTTTATYNAKNGNLISTKDVYGNVTEYTHNPYNGLTTNIANGTNTVSYDYNDNYKNIDSVTHGATTYSFLYDEYGNLSTAKAGNRALSTYTYLPNNGNIQFINYSNGGNIGYSYDHFGNASTIIKDNQKVAVTYPNGRGDAIRTVDYINDLETRLTHDTTGRLISKDVYTTDPNTNSDTWRRSFEYDYDDNNNLSKLSYIDSNGAKNITAHTYGADNLPQKTTLTNQKELTYTYDGLNRLTSKVLTLNSQNSDYIRSAYTFNASKRGSGYTTLSIASEKHTGFAYQYVYDKSGNIVGILNGVKGSNGNYTFPTVTSSSDYNQTFAYDRYNQLTTHNDNDSGTVTVYDYDNDGNITQKAVTVNGTTTTDIYTYADTLGWGDLLTKYNGQTITYDAIGNPLTYRDSMTMTWASGRELMTLSKGNTNLSFTYDPNGLRTKKTITTSSGTTNVEYIYEGGLLRQMKHGARYFDFFYDANDTAAGFAYRSDASSAPTYYYYGVNIRGDVEVIYNSSGLVLAKYKYDAYGKLLNVTNSADVTLYDPDSIAHLNPLRYRSYVYDTESGLYYLQARYYDPTTCRFINSDPSYISTGQDFNGYNMFVYCGNNPISFSDYSGTRYIASCSVETENSAQRSASCQYQTFGYSKTVTYDVPLYNQGNTNICWAYSQMMVEDYKSGTIRTPDEANNRAYEIAVETNGQDNWNSGNAPMSMGDLGIGLVENLYKQMCEYGPLVAVYYGYNEYGEVNNGHMVVVTGVDVHQGIVYTNNPWGIKGRQSYNEFTSNFEGNTDSSFKLYGYARLY